MRYSLRKWRMTDAEDLARALFEAMRKDYVKQEFTVHASPYAVPVYERLGFRATNKEQLTDGLRYTPMIFKGE